MSETNIDREFSWDDTITKDDEYVLLPEGNYAYTISKLERGRHAGSTKLPPCAKAILTVLIDGGELGSATITHNIFLHSKCEGIISQFFTSVGLKKHGEPLKMEWNKVVGKTGVCHVFIDEWTNDKGETRQSNKIKRFLPPQDTAAKPAAAETTATAAPAWAGKTW